VAHCRPERAPRHVCNLRLTQHPPVYPHIRFARSRAGVQFPYGLYLLPMDYANPHAVTQIGNGTATTTYAYDNNGNLTSAGTGTATTSYSYDYANRLIAILYNNATTSSYGYDAFGQRVYQISASTSAGTTTYPFKFYSVTSTTKSSTNYATSTEYVFNGDTLLVLRPLIRRSRTAAPQVRPSRATYTPIISARPMSSHQCERNRCSNTRLLPVWSNQNQHKCQWCKKESSSCSRGRASAQGGSMWFYDAVCSPNQLCCPIIRHQRLMLCD
jgi:YD repeat-containing protein